MHEHTRPEPLRLGAGPQFPCRARCRQPDGRGAPAERAAAHAEPPCRRAGGAAGHAAVRAHRPWRHAHRRGARHCRCGAADGSRRADAVALADHGPQCRDRHGAHHHQRGGGDLAAAAAARAAAGAGAGHRHRTGGVEPAHQPAAPRGRHRRAHGAAGAGLAGGAQARRDPHHCRRAPRLPGAIRHAEAPGRSGRPPPDRLRPR